MKMTFASLAGLCFCISAAAQNQPPRPRVSGIASVQFYSTNIDSGRDFYKTITGSEGTAADSCVWCERSPLGGTNPITLTDPPFVLALNSGQIVALSKIPKISPTNLLYQVVFATDDVKAMKKYLQGKIAIEKTKASNEQYIAVMDPEGHRIAFTQSPKDAAPPASHAMRIIHAGFVVHDRA